MLKDLLFINLVSSQISISEDFFDAEIYGPVQNHMNLARRMLSEPPNEYSTRMDYKAELSNMIREYNRKALKFGKKGINVSTIVFNEGVSRHRTHIYPVEIDF